MSQHYSRPADASNPHRLPNVETFRARPVTCKDCGAGSCLTCHGRVDALVCEECGGTAFILEPTLKWYWHPCFPGCLPDGPPNGPFATEAEALEDAREGYEE